LGDARAYYLSTAKNDLGVIFAQSVAGHTMIPISWEEMICPKTKVFCISFRTGMSQLIETFDVGDRVSKMRKTDNG
jgi:hypothetical protein